MIGVISGKVLFSDGVETILYTPSGVGYQIYCRHILPEGETTSLYISHVIRETSEDLYSFRSLREKKLFELIMTVKGVGPKSAFNLVASMNVEEIINAIQSEQKKTLTKIPGVGPKAASQIILDLQSKIQKVRMYSSDFLKNQKSRENPSTETLDVNISRELKSESEAFESDSELSENEISQQSILDDTLLACKNLGFSDSSIIPLAQKILRENDIKKPEQLVHLVLKEV